MNKPILDNFFAKHAQGVYGGSYQLGIKPYQGKNFTSKCFIFPGQGVAFPGMGSQFIKSNQAGLELFQQADQYLKQYDLPVSLLDYIYDNEKASDQHLKQVKNIALFVLEVAIYRYVTSKLRNPDLLTSHSFGEYACLASAHVVPFQDMLDIVYYREALLREENAYGYMLVAMEAASRVTHILKDVEFTIANLNSPRQTAIAVPDMESAKLILKQLKVERVSAKLLNNVPQPFHSPYLNQAHQKLKHYLDQKDFPVGPSEIPILSSVTGKILTAQNTNDLIVREMLANQLTAPVDFIAQVQKAREFGIHAFYELGPTDTHLGFVKEILGDNEQYLLKPVDLEKTQKTKGASVMDAANSQLFLVMKSIISKVTGYDLQEISLTDKFQEDLGIDSIKKAEIIFQVLNDTQIRPSRNFNLSQLKDLDSAIFYLDKMRRGEKDEQEEVKQVSFQRCRANWAPYCYVDQQKPEYKLKFIDFDQLLDFLNKEKRFFKRQHLLVVDARSQSAWSSEVLSEELDKVKQEFLKPLIKHVKLLMERLNAPLNLMLLINEQQPQFLAKALHPLLLSLTKENHFFHYKCLSLNQRQSQAELEHIVQLCAHDPIYVDIKYEAGEWFTKRLTLETSIEDVDASLPYAFATDDVVVAIGGAKGIGLELMSHLTNKHQLKLAVIGRSSGEDKQVQEAILRLSQGISKVQYFCADARDYGSLARAFEAIQSSYGPIKYMIQGAGYESSKLVVNKNQEEIDLEIDTKVLISHNCLRLSEELNIVRPIFFSSIVSHFGNSGQTIYSFANAYITQMIEAFNQKQAHQRALCIQWPAWDGVGMTANTGILQRLMEANISLMPKRVGQELFEHDLQSPSYGSLFYHDLQDDYLYMGPNYNFEHFYPCVGMPVDLGKLKFEREFNVSKDRFLRDHSINGISVVPAAYVIGSFFLMDYLKSQRLRRLEEIAISSMIIVDKHKGLKTTFERAAGDRYTLSSEIIHYSAKAAEPKFFKGLYHTDLFDYREVVVPSIYSPLGIHFNENLQFIKQAFISDDQRLRSESDNKLSGITQTHDYFDKLVKVIETSFQTLGTFGLYYRRSLGVPIKVDAIEVNQWAQLTEKLHFEAKVTFCNDERVLGHVMAFNDEKQIVMQMFGIEMVVINNPKAIQKNIVELYEPNTKPKRKGTKQPAASL